MSTLFSLPELYTLYKKWISSHPQLASDFETTIKWLSYFIAGRINNSTVVSELVYSLSNLVVLFNDRIIRKAQKLDLPGSGDGSGSGDGLKLWLSVLEYCEVFFELTAQKLWGQSGKWFIVVMLQIFKCFSRIMLIFYHKEPIIENPPIPTLKRRNLNQPSTYSTDYTINDARHQLETVSFVLRRSGKVIRKVEAAPSLNRRNWKPLDTENDYRVKPAFRKLAGKQIAAETLYIVKPLAHLGSVFCFGENNWRPWVTSLLFDLISLHLYQTSQKTSTLSKVQQLQISRRHLALLMYLLRSPFYDRYSRERIQSYLLGLAKKIPLTGMICTPLAQYIPQWQKTYFYMWST